MLLQRARFTFFVAAKYFIDLSILRLSQKEIRPMLFYKTSFAEEHSP